MASRFKGLGFRVLCAGLQEFASGNRRSTQYSADGLCNKYSRRRYDDTCYFQVLHTLPETNMETQNGPYKDYGPFKSGLYGFPCLRECMLVVA